MITLGKTIWPFFSQSGQKHPKMYLFHSIIVIFFCFQIIHCLDYAYTFKACNEDFLQLKLIAIIRLNNYLI